MLTLPAPAMNRIKSKKSRYPDSVFEDDYKGSPNWFCVWYDHAGRLIKRRLPEAASRVEATQQAAAAYAVYEQTLAEQFQIRWDLSSQEMEDLCEMATFPRAVVERRIRALCDHIAIEELGDTSPRTGSQPGLKIFADRTGISEREVHRILEEEERITVGCDTVDKICVKFGLLFHDFIQESLEWSERTGAWANRLGTDDPWPVGYTRITPIDDEGLI